MVMVMVINMVINMVMTQEQHTKAGYPTGNF